MHTVIDNGINIAMHFPYIVFVTMCCLKIDVHFVFGGHLRGDPGGGEDQQDAVGLNEAGDEQLGDTPEFSPDGYEGGNREDSEEPDTTPGDKHTFVALIDIVFTDGSKRTCTGAVIHDNVALTAAHCFIDRHHEYLTPELTFSFVVIGTKKMFETGYEQYLPIEKVISHPKFKGWAADLALVFTFAGMTSDKPGQVIPLAGGRSSAPVDSNVTVISWGSCSKRERLKPQAQTKGNFKDSDEKERSRSDDEGDGNERFRNSNIGDDDSKPYNIRYMAKVEPRARNEYEKTQTKVKTKTTKRISRYLTSDEQESEEIQRTKIQSLYGVQFTMSSISNNARQAAESKSKPTAYPAVKSNNPINKKKVVPKHEESIFIENDNSDEVMGYFHSSDLITKKKESQKIKNTKNTKVNKDSNSFKKKTDVNLKTYKNWRRQMGSQKNELSVEVFSYVNVQACKKIVERTRPSIYAIKNQNEILCYSSEDHYITNEDSGALALQNGHLVAVTVGGVKTDGEHIAIGMKMSCFCSWIAENLPDGDGEKLSCCRNCCDTKHFETDEKSKHAVYYRHGNNRPEVVRLQSKEEIEDSESDLLPRESKSRSTTKSSLRNVLPEVDFA